MRRLADHLEVTPMALYKWFDNKDALLDALTEQLLADSPARTPTTGPWLERAAAFASHMRRTMLSFLPLLQLEGASQRLAANAFRNTDEGLALMVEAGYRDADAVNAFRVLFWSVLNYCLVIDATGALPASGGGPSVPERLATVTDGPLNDSMPTLAAHLPFFDAVDPDAFFDRLVRTVLVGLRDAH